MIARTEPRLPTYFKTNKAGPIRARYAQRGRKSPFLFHHFLFSLSVLPLIALYWTRPVWVIRLPGRLLLRFGKESKGSSIFQPVKDILCVRIWRDRTVSMCYVAKVSSFCWRGFVQNFRGIDPAVPEILRMVHPNKNNSQSNSLSRLPWVGNTYNGPYKYKRTNRPATRLSGSRF